jgi:phospholipase C
MFKFLILLLSTAILLTVKTSVTASHLDIKTVFVILFENHDWAQITKEDAPYLNSLLSIGAFASQYYTPNLHPSEVNYVHLEAGYHMNLLSDADPTPTHSSDTPLHLVTLLEHKNLTWKAYQEDISGTVCPLKRTGNFAPKHLPQIFFTDVTGNNSETYPKCISHIRPLSEIDGDLSSGKIASYNFITPNLCNDMHDCSVSTGDKWLQSFLPKILESNAYKNNGSVFITWDEGGGGLFGDKSDGPIGMIVLSPLGKKNFITSTKFDHSSTLRTFQEIFGVCPFLRFAQNATSLKEMFINSTNAPECAEIMTFSSGNTIYNSFGMFFTIVVVVGGGLLG